MAIRSCIESKGHVELQPDTCSICRGWAPRKTRAVVPPAECIHLGTVTDLTVDCDSCMGVVKLKLFTCEVHGTCTAKRRVPGVACCDGDCEERDTTVDPKAITIDQGAGGIGDGLLGLTAVKQLKLDNPDSPVHYRCGKPAVPFVALFHGYDRLKAARRSHDESPVPGSLQMNAGYNREQRTRYTAPRWERYAANIGASGNALPLLREPYRIRKLGRDVAGFVALCPFSTDVKRTWPLQSWLALEDLLHRAGYRTVILHSKPEGLEEFKGVTIVGQEADRVAGVLLNSSMTIGSDTGLPHLAAIMGVPTIVLGGGTPVDRIFGFYPSVSCIQGTLPCSACGGVGEIAARCVTACDNLNGITPARVLDTVDRVWLGDTLAAKRALVSHDRLASIRGHVRATNHLAGDLAELGVFRGGSAKVIGHYAPDSTLHLFDTFAGIPEDDAIAGGHRAGEFACGLDDVLAFLVNPNVVPHVGTFPGTAPAEYRYRFVHVDGDTYQTTLAACEYFAPRMTPGGVLVFDDYQWQNCPGVAKALADRFGERVAPSARHQAVVRF